MFWLYPSSNIHRAVNYCKHSTCFRCGGRGSALAAHAAGPAAGEASTGATVWVVVLLPAALALEKQS